MIQAQGALDDPAAGQHLEGVRVALADDLQLDLQAGGPGDELSGVSRISPGQPDAGAAAGQVPQQGAGGVAVVDDAAMITTVSTRPVASTAMCRLRPPSFSALSQSRLAQGTVSAARATVTQTGDF
ncbi:MAG TPA: hypothetical protein VK584_00800 [Streptosporangiaceae bacterium]|nr:hypothetical protein [Streptosporangiaceae bacterium]